ncbi:homocysteine S-methyltransferase family protein [Shimia haliotis]|uniref:Homocysteine S-methyltransferase n=1 Tax=Shimia haliotis TaxID=1280847 RepID=A0A1I4FIE0_9RHOB|nr:homocysteine S-methyltransferase family protein [Shimia haliotis]SFL17708.1 homocysteine S-methyltransferase [Shimia haliotis]
MDHFLLPHVSGEVFLAYTGFETDLLFNHGAELPGFASYPLLKSADGRALLRQSYQSLMDLGARAGVGVILESTTWLANRERGAAIGYSPEALRSANIEAIAFMQALRGSEANVLLSANVGPRADAYAPDERMEIAQAARYHAEQMDALSQTKADLVSGYTLSYPEEAAGIALAAKNAGLPVVIAFTVETDGRLPVGVTLETALAAVDQATEGYPAYYMVNCAHPEHLRGALGGPVCRARLRGVVANASRCSHAELDNAEVLDSGDPEEFGAQMAQIARENPQISVLGGCCGTDMRHLGHMLAALNAG